MPVKQRVLTKKKFNDVHIVCEHCQKVTKSQIMLSENDNMIYTIGQIRKDTNTYGSVVIKVSIEHKEKLMNLIPHVCAHIKVKDIKTEQDININTKDNIEIVKATFVIEKDA